MSLLYYFYYRTCQFNNSRHRSDAPPALFLALNLAAIFNYVTRSVIYLTGSDLEVPPLLILVNGIILFIVTFGVMVLLGLNRRKITKRMDDFKKEPQERRERNGKFIIYYIVSSVVFVVLSYII
jgi:hypothetical protein